jgi:integral membrane protein
MGRPGTFDGMSAPVSRPPGAATGRRPGGLLTAYRVVSLVTGVGLLALTLYAMPMKYLRDDPGPVAVIGQIHGFLYMLYLVIALLLASRCKWSLVKTVLVLLAGTVPFAVFFAERRVVRDEQARSAS